MGQLEFRNIKYGFVAVNLIDYMEMEPMISVVLFALRLIVGSLCVLAVVLVFDEINDRNTEIIVSAIALLYTYIFALSRRMQYFGLSVFSLFGRIRAYAAGIPYDLTLRDEVGLGAPRNGSGLNIAFAIGVELLAAFRLATSLRGHGWEHLSTPLNAGLQALIRQAGL